MKWSNWVRNKFRFSQETNLNNPKEEEEEEKTKFWVSNHIRKSLDDSSARERERVIERDSARVRAQIETNFEVIESIMDSKYIHIHCEWVWY